MTKQEVQWIYGSLAGAIIIFLFFLYLVSDFSPLARSDSGQEFLLPESGSEASGEVELILP